MFSALLQKPSLIVYGLTALIFGAALWIAFARSAGRNRRQTRAFAGMPDAHIVMGPGVEVEERPSVTEEAHSATDPVNWERRAPVSATGRRRVLVVGAGEVGRRLARSLQASGRYYIVGFIDEGDGKNHSRYLRGDWRILGTRDQTAQIAAEYAVDDVVLAYAPTWQQRLVEELATRHPEVSVRIVPSSFDALMRINDLECYNDIALVSLGMRPLQTREVVKRLCDILIAIVGLLVLSPFMLLAAALIRLSSPGPVIYAQQRVGLNGNLFTLFKFRTMVQDAEKKSGPVLAKGTQDSRLTPVGRWLRRFRIDEIPQLWNILRGEMSLVGPRPERPYFVEQFEKKTPTYALRHRVRPGMTGLAQVCGGYHTDARDKLRFDLIYVAYHSLWLDLSLLLRTFLVILNPMKSGDDS